MSVTSQKHTDSVPWVVKTPTGILKTKDSFKSFADADKVARSHTFRTGQFAQAVRS